MRCMQVEGHANEARAEILLRPSCDPSLAQPAAFVNAPGLRLRISTFTPSGRGDVESTTGTGRPCRYTYQPSGWAHARDRELGEAELAAFRM